MKKLFPFAIIAVFGLLTFGSCKKSSSNATCTCKSKGVSGSDTTYSFSTVAAGYASLTAYCDTSNSALQLVLGSAYGCHL